MDSSVEGLYHLEQSRLRATQRRRRRTEQALSVAVLALFIGSASYLSTRVNPVIFPSPMSVILNLVAEIQSGRMVPHILVTIEEVVAGFLVGSLVGLGLGISLAEFSLLRNVFNPYIIVSQAIPKGALAPIFIIWMGFGATPKIAIAALIAFFPLLENAVVGLRGVDPDALTLFRSFRASRWQVLWRLRFPSALPLIFAGLRVAMVLAIVGAVVGEYVGANRGLGALIIVAQGTVDTTLMFAVFVVLTAVSIGLYYAVEGIERLVLGRRYRRA